MQNVFNLVKFIAPSTNVVSDICRMCYNKATGFSTSREKQMVEYLKTQSSIAPYPLKP